MRVRYLKDHLGHIAGTEEEIGNELANYLIRVKAAEEVKEDQEEGNALKTLREMSEKQEIEPAKEKAENKTGNVPTAKKKKK